MNDRIEREVKTAFSRIHADPALRSAAEEAVLTGMKARSRRTPAVRKLSLVLAAVLLVLLGAGGAASYLIPVAAISVDINPSVELQVNLYDRVIGVEGYNEDGKALAESLDLKHRDYEEAVSLLTEAESVRSLLEENGLIELTVTGSSKAEEKIQHCLSSHHGKVYRIDSGHPVEEAHSAGMSFGKYRAYLELKEEDPAVTEEEVRELTMREIRDQINGCGGGHCPAPEEPPKPHQESEILPEKPDCGGHHGHKGHGGCRK